MGRKPALCHLPGHDLGFEPEGDFGKKPLPFSVSAVCSTHLVKGVRRSIRLFLDNPANARAIPADGRVADGRHAQTIR
ncbi:MAG: hypothetical protein HPY44_16275 [Armatimonadetes bacterium]|jgi:hypothetical protein|nr:hypothetical protein [Armatimonadota bacterium]